MDAVIDLMAMSTALDVSFLGVVIQFISECKYRIHMLEVEPVHYF